MIEFPVIPNKPPEHPGMDFALLRQEGIRYIIKLAGEVWTDYNTHDPGITILEQVCYAITDLSYRLGFDIRDLLAYPPDHLSDGKRKQFFTALDVLTSNPLTIQDYRKLIIDVDGVKNAWLEKMDKPLGEIWYNHERYELTFKAPESGEPLELKGLYSVLIEKEDSTVKDADLIEKVRLKLSNRRNLCEDFEEIKILPVEEIAVQVEVAIENDCDANDLLAEIHFRLANHVSPSIPFYSRKEMEANGKTVEEIFNGPPLEHGFIDDDQLRKAERKPQIHTSDLIRNIQEIEGVKAVMKIGIAGKSRRWHKWSLDLSPEHVPRLKSIAGSIDDIKLYKGESTCPLDEKKMQKKLDSMAKISRRTMADEEKDIPIALGMYRELSDYETIQNDFPLNYGVGYFGLTERVTTERKALANQLRAYLMFFDQILANYFSQLAHAKDLFSPYYQENASYFFNMLPEEVEAKVAMKTGAGVEPETVIVKLLKANGEELRDIIEPLDTAGKRRERLEKELQGLVESRETALERKNRFLDHLMARYCEEFADYSLLYSESDLPESYVKDKQEFIKDYPLVSGDRSRAFDYTDPKGVWETENVSGLKKRICRKLGISDYKRKSLAPLNEEGFHLIEHILLRPGKTDTRKSSLMDLSEKDANGNIIPPEYPDRFSFQLSIVFPNWPGRLKNESFRRLIEDTVITETPAHITANFHWMNKEQMHGFEEWYRRWLQRRAEDSADVQEAVDKLVELLHIGRAAPLQNK